MDPLSWLITFALLYGGGFVNGYLVNDKECKSIELTIPKKYSSIYEVPDCLESEGEICAIPEPRYVVPETGYIEFNKYVKGMRVHLDGCIDVTDQYNKNKYIEK